MADLILTAWPRWPTTSSVMNAFANPNYQLSQLDILESEAIYIFREVIAEFERPSCCSRAGRTRSSC